jgi:hypothetical protein
MGDKEKQEESSHAGASTTPQVLPHGSMGASAQPQEKEFGVQGSEFGVGEQKKDAPAITIPQVLPHGSMGDNEKQEQSSHAVANTTPQVLPHGSMGDEEKKFGVWSSEFGVFGGEPGSFRTGHQTPPLYGARDAYHYHWGMQSTEFEVRNFEKGSFTTECGVVGGDGRKSSFQSESSMRTSGQQKNLSPQSSSAGFTIPFTLPQLSTAGCFTPLPHDLRDLIIQLRNKFDSCNYNYSGGGSSVTDLQFEPVYTQEIHQ